MQCMILQARKKTDKRAHSAIGQLKAMKHNRITARSLQTSLTSCRHSSSATSATSATLFPNHLLWNCHPLLPLFYFPPVDSSQQFETQPALFCDPDSNMEHFVTAPPLSAPNRTDLTHTFFPRSLVLPLSRWETLINNEQLTSGE